MSCQQGKFDFDKVLEAFKPFDTLMDKYYNTTNLSGPELKTRQMRAGTQNWIILQFFKDNPGMLFTPWQVQVHNGMIRTPITSVRRSLTTLTELGYLEKTSIMRAGNYGEINHTWKLK